MALSVDPGPVSGNALLTAAEWVEGVLLGPLGTSLAVIAVAWVGFAMLNGQLSTRRAVQVVLGIFILFGSPLIVREVVGSVRGAAGSDRAGPSLKAQPLPPSNMPPNYDPYAGAAVPRAGN